MSVQQGTINKIEFQSDELGEIMPIFVYTPASYSPLHKYSLLIAQDGKDYFQMGKLPRTADELLHQKKINNVIIVGVHYKNMEDRRRKYHPTGEDHQAYIRFLAHELVPWLDREYPTYGMGNSRTLIGDSLAATASLMAAVKYPNIFGQVILQSPYVDDHVLTAVANHLHPDLLNVYHVIGKDETDVAISDTKDFLSPNRKLHQLFMKKKLHSFYDEFDGGHSWKYWQTDVKRALQMMLST